ncbi:MAG: tRNA uridine-5-carboxymethylaminomethyl(34) synthesis GTPase MnmE [Bacteroidota bacterium]|nr:tRNA uridine-5-carboxymethylaminomethyl(34) synthesis GTPase MnmE [Bacteroidota bacterium]
MSHREDTIVAIATPSGMGAIAVLRISGPDSISLVDSVFRNPSGTRKDLKLKPGYSVHFGAIHDGDTLIDEVLCTMFRAPHSYTGEDTVEISCHGSTFIQRELLQLFLRKGARLADPGEFTLRAFLHGKMDLSQAEAVADLIASENQASADVALRQMRGGFSKELSDLREQLIQFASLIELELDFSEEDVEFANRDQLTDLLNRIRQVLKRLQDSFALGNAIKNGIPVAIVGAPNAGKSTLLNALLKEERAIVSDIAGTTRDVIEDEIHLGGLTFRFIDTAGLRDTSDHVESIGIRKAYEKVDQASIVLYLVDLAHPPFDIADRIQQIRERAGNKPVILLGNKADRVRDETPDWITEVDHYLPISALSGEGLEEVQQALLDQVETSALSNNEVVVTNARHYQNLVQAFEAIQRVQGGLESGISGDLLAQDVREALRYLGNITGEIDVDRDILGTIFGKFCIGK